MAPEKWPHLDWDELEEHHALQLARLDQRVPLVEHSTFESWRDATQRYQADLLRHQVEALRRLKYRPAGGFCMFHLADAHPAVSCAVLDHDRVAKRGYDALAEACRPIIVIAERAPAMVLPGDAVALDVHVVSDRRTAVPDAVISAVLSWEGGHHGWRWEGEVPSDSCVRVGTVQLVVPDAPGALVLDLDLVGADTAVSNRYESLIIPRA
jgi:beta-mannosidase